MLYEGLRLNIGRVGDNIGSNGHSSRQKVKPRLSIAVVYQVSRPNIVAMFDKDLRNMPAAATGFPNVFREAFEL